MLLYPGVLTLNMVKEMVLTVTLRPESEGGYSVVCNELEVASQGESVDEALKNIKEAVELYLESADELGMMDDVLEQLGFTKEDLKKHILSPKTFTASIPVEVSI